MTELVLASRNAHKIREVSQILESAGFRDFRLLSLDDIGFSGEIEMTPEEKINERRRELRSTFLRMMGYVRDREIDYVLISGDLFDTEYATSSTADVII